MDPYDHDLERGLRNRRAILGDAWVDQSTAKANAFTADFQNFITRYAWHEVWGRPGLSAKTRRILVLAITCAPVCRAAPAPRSAPATTPRRRSSPRR